MTAQLSQENPIEMIDRYNLREGELAMYVAYAGRDQFNVTAQVDSFRYRAKERGLSVSYGFDPRERRPARAATREDARLSSNLLGGDKAHAARCSAVRSASSRNCRASIL